VLPIGQPSTIEIQKISSLNSLCKNFWEESPFEKILKSGEKFFTPPSAAKGNVLFEQRHSFSKIHNKNNTFKG